MAKQFSPVVALHRSLFVGLCHEIATRQEARAIWAQIGKSREGVDPRFLRRWTAASNLLKRQVGDVADEFLKGGTE